VPRLAARRLQINRPKWVVLTGPPIVLMIEVA
jgi:hypothetical protein